MAFLARLSGFGSTENQECFVHQENKDGANAAIELYPVNLSRVILANRVHAEQIVISIFPDPS
jgi:hypothetical protein